MKKTSLLLLAIIGFITFSLAQEYKVVTIVESIVPMGLGRSRIIEHDEVVNSDEFTTVRVGGKDSNQGDVKRKAAKIDNMKETKLLNFYSGVGINFQNIASNDALITDKINKMIAQGWDIAFVLSGVESKGSESDNQGLFITRLIFKK